MDAKPSVSDLAEAAKRGRWHPSYAMAAAIVFASAVWGFSVSTELARFIVWLTMFCLGGALVLTILAAIGNTDSGMLSAIAVLVLIGALVAGFGLVGALPDFVFKGVLK